MFKYIFSSILVLSLVVKSITGQVSGALTATNYTINQASSYTLQILRFLNPITGSFINPVTPAQIGSYIQLIFPGDYLNDISEQTNPSCFSSPGAELSCVVNEFNNTITINNYYADQSTLSVAQINITINDIINPRSAKQTQNFIFKIMNPDKSVLDQSPQNNPGFSLTMTFVHAQFNSCQISANNNYISTYSRFTFTISPKNFIPSSGLVKIQIPLYWSGDIAQEQSVKSSPTCIAISGISGSISCSYSVQGSPVNIATITITSLSTSGLSQEFSIDISSILTPPFVNSIETINIQSMQSDGTIIDSCQSAVSNTEPIPFKSNTFVSNDQTIVQSAFIGRMDLRLAKSFNYQDSIIMQVPSIFINNGQISLTCNQFTFQSSVNLQTVTISNIPSSINIISTNNPITFNFLSAKNPDSTQPIEIVVTFRRQNQAYQTGTISYTAVAATSLSVNFQSDNLAIKSIDNTIIQLSDPQIYIPKDSIIQMQYHSSIQTTSFSSKPVVRASLGGTVVNGVTYNVDSNTLQINGLFAGSQLAANKLIEIEIQDIVNPPTIQPTIYTFKIFSSTGYLIISGQYSFTAALQSLISNSVSVSSLKVMDTFVTYSVTFQSNYDFKSVSIIIPSEITVISGYQSTCAPNTFTSCSLNGHNLTFIGSMTAGAYTLQWGNNANPNSFKPTSSFSIFTYSSGWGVQKSSGFISITMNQVAELVSQQISPNSYTNNQVIDIQVDFSVPSDSPSGTISVTVPSVIDIIGSTCSVSTGQSCTIIPPKITIAFSNPSAQPGLDAIRKVLTIQNAVNAPSFKPIENFIFILRTQDSYQSLSSEITAWTNLYTSSTFTAIVSSDDGYRLQEALFTFSLSNLSGKQTYVNIKIPQSFGELTVPPSGATLINSRLVRFNIEGQGSSQISMSLQTPQSKGEFTFTLQTYTNDDYLIDKIITNVWRHSCYDTQCRACYTNSSCIDCYSLDISNFYIYNTNSQQCTRQCLSGFYLVGTSCSPCGSNCDQCITTANNCTACETGKFLDTIHDVCVETCSDGYYPNNLNKQCSICVSPCLKCTSETSCLTCIQNFYLLQDLCLSNCPNGIMVKYQPDRTCRNCTENCLTCQTYDYYCTSCRTSEGLYLDFNECVSECSQNRFVKDQVCSPCQLPCKVCYNSTKTCSSCYADQTLNLWFNWGCISPDQCVIGYYVNSVNLSCDACPDQCQQCLSLLNCSACASGFYLFSNKCGAQCPNTTFINQNDRTCDQCIGCQTCSEENICTTCQIDQYLYAGQCYTICPDSLYPDEDNTNGTIQELICSECPSQCPTCLNFTFCKSCVSGQLLYQGDCYGSCPYGAYKISDTLCETCPQTCLNCTSAANCLACQPSYSLQNSMCVLKCQKGISYYQMCYACGLNCQTCQDTTCTQCDPNYYLLNGACFDNCSLSTLSLDGQTCVPCTQKFINCTTCNENQCLSCSDGQLTNGQCIPCSEGDYSRNSFCVSCPSSCSACANATYCTSCNNKYYMEQNFCIDTCPDNKFPNGTKCDVCMANCSICDQQTALCHICFAGMYRFEGSCFQNCPNGYVVNLNATVCITEEDYAEQYSQQSKIIYFPFTIATFLVVIIGVILKCYIKAMHLPTFLVSIIAWLQLGSWILFGVIEYLFLINLQTDSLKGLACIGAAIITLIITNFVFLRLYYKYFSQDMDFIKWQRSHCCINMTFVVIATIFNFKIHRILYSKILDREQFSLVLSSVKKLIPISVLSVISLFVSSAPVIVGCSLALYFSLNIDQQFWAALDTLIVTGIMAILILIDLKHPHNYMIDELETQNIKNKIYQEDDQQFVQNFFQQKGLSDGQKNDGNMSKHNLLVGQKQQEQYDNLKTAKKFYNRNSSNRGGRTLREGESLGNNNNDISEMQLNFDKQNEIEDLSQDMQNQSTQVGPKWIPKNFDHHGYLVKYDENNNPVRYDQHGHRVEIDEDGNHHKYDQNGYEAIEDQNGKYVYYDKEGWIVDRQTGKRYDNRGYLVKKNQETGQIEYFDEHGYKVITDPQTKQETKYNQDGYIVKIDQKTNQHKLYNKQGYRVVDKDGVTFFINQDGKNVRKKQDGTWQCYDPTDGHILKKNQETGQYQKFDEYGFKIEKDQYGNEYKYEPETGYRVIIGQNGQIKRYDDQGYEVKKDLSGKQHKYDKDGYQVVIEDGNKVYYDKNGYRVQRDFYGNPTLFDADGNQIVIDKQTGKHRKFTPEGLQIIKDDNGDEYLRDKRGRKVIELQDGYYEKYDEVGNKIWLDDQGYEVQADQYGNQIKYDKVGDLVDEDQEQQDFELQGDTGLQQGNLAVLKQNKKKQRKKFKAPKQFDFEDQYKKMLEVQNPGLIFDEEDEIQEDTLKQFHDYQPPQQKQLEKQYNTLCQNQMGNQLLRNFSESSMKLENLSDMENTPWALLKEKRLKTGQKVGEQQQQQNKMTIDPQNNLQKFEAKSVADVSINERSFQNEGVNPISSRKQSHNQDDQLNSLQELSAANFQKNKLINKRSHASFEEDQKIETKSQNNYQNIENSNIPITIQNSNSGKKSSKYKIYDSDQDVESLEEEDWQNQSNPDIFYKDKQFSNANTNANDKGLQVDDQQDILSDYIPQQSIDQDNRHKGSQNNLLGKNNYMQSIQQVEDQLFDRLKIQDNQKVKRGQFRLSGTPNPLLEYAKTIQAKKMEDRQKGSARYKPSTRR